MRAHIPLLRPVLQPGSYCLHQHMCRSHLHHHIARIRRRLSQQSLSPAAWKWPPAHTQSQESGQSEGTLSSAPRSGDNRALFECYNRQDNEPWHSRRVGAHTSSVAQKHAPRLVFSCVRAGLVPVAPAVGAVLAHLRLAHWWHAVWCDVCVVSSLAACIAP